MVAVTTSLGHGIASPVSTLRHESGTGRYSQATPSPSRSRS